MLEIAAAADLLLNISGHLTLEPLKRLLRRKAYLDLDPGFTQFWHAAGHDVRLDNHDCHFTIGENIGTHGCGIPTGDIRWRHTRQPAVLDANAGPDHPWRGRFTTVASWRGPYGPVQHGSQTFGVKVHEFRKLIDLPQRVPAAFEIALDIHHADARDLDGLRAESEAGRRMGFVGRMAIHPAQVAVIEAAYAPTEEERAWAARIVAAFEAQPGAGVISLDGKMVDRPHLVQARRILGQ